MSKINKVVVKGVSYDIEDANARKEIKTSAWSDGFDFFAEKDKVGFEVTANSGNHSYAYIPVATTEKAGVMTAEDKVNLANSTVTKVTWGSSSNMNSFTTAGVYSIKGTRTNLSDNIPITNTGENATIAAKLFVTVTPEGTTTYRHSVGQTLILSNAEGKETKMYTRNGNRTSTDGGVTYTVTWGAWATLQTNINVETVDNLDNLKDNGIYSGVWTKGSYNNYPLTFVCIVINDYMVGIAPRRISQFVYGLSKLNGTVVYQTRVWDDSKNAWGDWEILNQKEISSMISNEIKKITDGVDPEKLDSLKDLIAWVDTHGGEVAGIKSDIQANEAAIEMEAERAIEAEEKLEEKIAKEKNALVNGDTIVGLAREVYSRQGKVDSATFLKRTTAGGTSVSDGVASVKQIGGNILKNLVDSTFETWTPSSSSSTVIVDKGVVSLYNDTAVTLQVRTEKMNLISNHKYYLSAFAKSDSDIAYSFNSLAFNNTFVKDIHNAWIFISVYGVHAQDEYKEIVLRAYSATYLHATNPLLLDLTEMFGAGKEPTKEECDRMFGTMDALPKGLTIAQPTGLKSTGFNQWNPTNVLLNKSIVENAIEDEVADRHIAIVECLPCKIGTGENNGYIIGYGEGDSWSVEDIEVYFSPLNPMDYIGQDVDLYMHKLEADSDYGSYVPQCKGYLLIVTPTIDKLCVHFHWSGDREITDYEEYIESNVALPVIPEMSEWGLAGVRSGDSMEQDTIDLDRMVFTKRIGAVDMGSLPWGFDSYNNTMRASVSTIKPATSKSFTSGIIQDRYNFDTTSGVSMMADKSIRRYATSIYIKDNSYADAESFKASLQGVMLYYEIAEPEEYPIVTKTAPNYIGSDYGVEEFTDSKIPLAANILFYMRSLVGETRNFIDQLYTNTQKTDAKEVADYITDGIESNKQLATEAPNLALRALYIAAGAEYNDSGADKTKTAPWGETVTHKAGHYYLNGLGDITEAQMMNIYIVGNRGFRELAYTNEPARTFITRNTGNTSLPFQSSLRGCFFMCPNIETLGDGTEVLYSENSVAEFFRNCSKLKYINTRYIFIQYASSVNRMFDGCAALERVLVDRIAKSISFASSPRISKESILYAIEKAIPTSAITITLHPDAYARLAEDADIVAALEAQPLVTLVSA